MSDFFKAYLEYAGVGHSEAPTVFHRWTAVSMLGAMLGRRVYFPFGHSSIYPNQYIMLMGSPGTRKSTAINIGAKLLAKTGYSRFASDRTSKERFLIDMAAYDDMAELDENDLLALTLNEPAETYVVAEEFTDFVGQNNTDFITMLTKLWDCPPEYKHPKIHGKSVEVNQPTVNILGGNTPQGFALAFPPESLGNGFLSRMLFIYGESTGIKVTFPAAPDSVLSENLVTRLKAIKQSCAGKMQVSHEAEAICHRIYAEFKDLDDSRFKHYSTRRFTHILKLATIIACSKISTTIHKQDILEANTMLHYAECKMPKALGEFGKSKYSDVTSMILEILNASHKPLTLTDLWKKVSRELTKIQELGDIMRNLQHAEKVQIQKVGTHTGYLPLHTNKAGWASDLLIPEFLTIEEREGL